MKYWRAIPVLSTLLISASLGAQESPRFLDVSIRDSEPAIVSTRLLDRAGRLVIFNYHLQADGEKLILPWGQRAPAKVGQVLAEIPFAPADLATYTAAPAANFSGVGTYQAGGPEHTFFIGKFEVTQQDVADFLNNAELNPNNTLGGFTFVDETDGAVYFNPTPSTTTLLFDPLQSLVLFDPGKAVGSRYTVLSGFEKHPATGMSWFGALKYCNWLTVFNGLGDAARCYTEGLAPEDWHPTTATSWPAFTDTERDAWVAGLEGFRLPMFDDPEDPSNLHNEFAKAATWTGTRTTHFGHGRFLFLKNDGNHFESGDPFADVGTTPIGYYNGTFQPSRTGTDLVFRRGQWTRRQKNQYDLFDMTGNVGEWQTDAFATNWRVVAGGSYRANFDDLEVDEPRAVIPYAGLDFIGFRLAKSTAVMTGTNEAGNLPLTIFPTGIGTLPTIISNFPFSALYGDITNYSWSVTNASIGFLTDATGSNTFYNAIETNEGFQAIILADGITAVTSAFEQINIPPPPTP